LETRENIILGYGSLAMLTASVVSVEDGQVVVALFCFFVFCVCWVIAWDKLIKRLQ